MTKKTTKRKASLPADIEMMQDTVRLLRDGLNGHVAHLTAASEEMFAEIVLLRSQREAIAASAADLALRVSEAEQALTDGKLDMAPLAASRQVFSKVLTKMSEDATKFYAGRGDGNQPMPDEFVSADDVANAVGEALGVPTTAPAEYDIREAADA